MGVGRWLPPLAIVVALIGAWELAARLDAIANALNLEPFLVPAPSDIAQALWQDRALLADNAWVTLQEVLAGFALSVAAGVAFAIVLHLSPACRRAFYPLLVASQTVPIVVVAPILVVWLGFGIGPKLAIIALICFFPITVNTLDGLGSVDPDLVKMMRTLDANRWQTLRRDWIASLPSIETELLEADVEDVPGPTRDVAIVKARLRWLARTEGRSLNGTYAVTDVFTNDQGRWRASWRIWVRLTDR